jgi:hypothetical protein
MHYLLETTVVWVLCRIYGKQFFGKSVLRLLQGIITQSPGSWNPEGWGGLFKCQNTIKAYIRYIVHRKISVAYFPPGLRTGILLLGQNFF